ncbi:hypothetical protein H0H93_002904, partial [Arthromyces matolae]
MPAYQLNGTYNPGYADLQEWRGLSPDPTGLPKPDTSFNWLPPPATRPQPTTTQQQFNPASFGTTPSSAPAMYIPGPTVSQNPTTTTYNTSHSFFAGYEPPPVSTGYDTSANMVSNQTGALLELGLMR